MRKYDIVGSKCLDDTLRHILLSLPPIYIADSVNDFNAYRLSKERVRCERNRDSETKKGHYITIGMYQVRLIPCFDAEDNPLVVTNEYNEHSYVFLIKDKRQKADPNPVSILLWPRYPSEPKEREEDLKRYVNQVTDISGLFLIYDRMFDNAFIKETIELPLKSIDDIMRDIWPQSKL